MTNFSDLNILIIESNYYKDVAQNLRTGATTALKNVDAEYEIITVPGALEIPIALSMAIDSELLSYDSMEGCYHGCVALGCVIRGETFHYDIVANESARGLMHLAITSNVALGNGILTVDNKEQALERADIDKGNKGGAAVRACLDLIQHKNRFEDWA